MITLVIKNKSNSTFRYKTKLKKEGFKYNNEKKYWYKDLECDKATQNKQIKKYKDICKKNNLSLIEKNSNYTRSNSYRKDFFKAHPYGVIGNYYQCAYCGKLVKKENLTIDHLFPIKRVEKGRFKKMWRFFLKIKGIKNINQTKNLVGACQSCNLSKGTKLKKWYLKGCIGRHWLYWLIKWMIYLILILSALQLVVETNILKIIL